MQSSRHRIWGHALRNPTRWDIQVPLVFWANVQWRNAHPGQWAKLVDNASRPLMHLDVVPTLLSAAGIRYQDFRAQATDLLKRSPPRRMRVVQASIGSTIEWETLLREAR